MSYNDIPYLDGGIQAILPEAFLAESQPILADSIPQLVYLDFDGAETSYRNQELDISINNICVEDSGFDATTISFIVATLNDTFGDDIIFTAEIPQEDEYSTIYIGKTDAFDDYGNFLGLAETIDVGNQIHNDNAFVFLDSNASIGLVTSVITHETQHIVSGYDHGGENLQRFARSYSGWTTLSGEQLILHNGDYANSTTVSGGFMIVSSGATANSTTVSGGSMIVASGGTANYTTVNKWGRMYVHSGGTALNVIWTPCVGTIDADDGATVTYASNYKGVYFGSGHTLLSSALTMSVEHLFWHSMYVMNGGTANSTTINLAGDMYVYSGGTANSTTVGFGGSMIVASGGTAWNIVEDGGYVSIVNGANVTFASHVIQARTISRAITVHSGTTANSTTISDGGMYVSSGGTANSTTVSGGGMYVSSGGTANSTTVSGGSMIVASGGTANYTTVNKWGRMYVHSGGTANSTTVSGGSMYVSSGGKANFTTVSSGGCMVVYSGGTANSTTVLGIPGAANEEGGFEEDEYGVLFVYSGGTANSTTVSGGGMYVSSGGTGLNIVEDGGYVGIADGANVTFVPHVIQSKTISGNMTVHSGTTANSTTVKDDGWMYVSSGGTADSTIVSSGGCMDVWSGGTANSTTVVSSGWMYVNSGGTALNVVNSNGRVGGVVIGNDSSTLLRGVHADGTEFYISNGVANNIRGTLDVRSGGTANSTTVSGGCMDVWSGGTANSTTVSGGWMNVWSGGTAWNIVEDGGYVWIAYGANATFVSHVIESRTISTTMTLHSGTTANSTTVSGGRMYVFSGGTANFTTVSDGEMYVYRGGTANSTTVSSGGHLCLAGGSVNNIIYAGGSVSIEDEGEDTLIDRFSVCSAYSGAELSVKRLDFLLSEAVPDSTVCLVEDINCFVGVEEYSITVAANPSMEQGRWFLAGGITSWLSSDITIHSASDDKVLGTLALFSPKAVIKGYGTYTLAWFGNSLYLDYTNDGIGVKAPTVTASTTVLTNQSVTVTATFDAEATIRQYSLNNATWKNYTGSVTMSENGTVYFRSGDGTDYSEVVSYTVTNIDKTAPVKPTVTGEKDDNQVIVTAEYSEDSVVRQYRIDGGNWQNYVGALQVAPKASVEFRGKDEAGNWSETTLFRASSVSAEYSGGGSLGGTVLKETSFFDLAVAGYFTVTGDFANLNATITLKEGKKTLATGTVKNGVVVFNKGKDVLLDKDVEYTLEIASADKGKTAGLYAVTVEGTTLFDAGDNSDDSLFSPALPVFDEANGWEGWAGYGDAIDYRVLTLDNAARLSFDVSATDAAKFTIWGTDAKTGKVKSLQATALKANKAKTEYTAVTKDLLLEAGTYHISVEATNAKKGGSADYTVALGERAVFFTEGDNSDNTATATALPLFDMADGWTDWAGYGDAIDYRVLTLDTAARLSFDVVATDAAKFTIWGTEAKTGKLKSLQATALKANKTKTEYTLVSKDLLLEAGTYYLSVEATNAKKGGSADYSVAMGERAVFFTEGDNSDDTATAQALPEFDAAVGWEGWAGYGDAVDYRVLHLDTAACLDFDVVASDAAKFTIWGKDAKGKLKSLQATTLKANKTKTEYSATNKNLMVAAGTYYLSVEATNAKKGGSADYTVSTGAAWQLFPQGDNTNDSWKMAALQGAHAVGETVEGWVGFGDTADFTKFGVEESGKLTLELDATTTNAVKNKELKLSFCDAKGKSIALTAVDEDTYVTKTAVALGECYLGVTCANASKYNTKYGIAVGM